MFDYLEKFNQLPKSLKDKVSNPSVLAAVDVLDQKYHVELAPFIMKLMIKAVSASDLSLRLAEEFTLENSIAEALSQELKEKVLVGVADYLGLSIAADPYSQKIAGAVNQIIAQVSDFPNADKLADSIKMYLRGVRNMVDTKEALAKNFSLSFEQIEKLIGLMDVAKKNLVEPLPPKPAGVLDRLGALEKKIEAPYDLLKVLDTKYELKGGLDLSHELPAAPKPQEQAKSLGIPPKVGGTVSIIHEVSKFDHEDHPTPPVVEPIKPKVEAPPVVTPPVVSAPKPMPPKPPLVKPVLPSRPAVRDIKPMKVMNPIDEIRFLDVTNFRRLGNTPLEMAAKIKARIDLLSKEDYQKGLAAMRSFRESPLGRLYLAILNYSFSQGIDLNQAVNLFKDEDPNSLTFGEVEAIMELNKSIN